MTPPQRLSLFVVFSRTRLSSRRDSTQAQQAVTAFKAASTVVMATSSGQRLDRKRVPGI